MAVPKKRTSKAKKNARKANWKNQAKTEAQKAISLGKSVLTRKSNGFIYSFSETVDSSSD